MPPEARRSREIEATGAEIWSTAVTAIYETDPEVIAAVLPKPLAPADRPLVRCTITSVQMPVGPTFGAGWFGVAARHGDEIGEYPIFMPMTTEQSVWAGVTHYGEPKKIADVWAKRTATPSTPASPAWASRSSRSTARSPRRASPTRRPSATSGSRCLVRGEAAGELDQDPLLVYGEKTEKARVHETIEGEIILKESPLDPIADLAVGTMVDINWTERASTQVGRIIGPVPHENLSPFLHQRYDDLSVLEAAARTDLRPVPTTPSTASPGRRPLHDRLGRCPLRACPRADYRPIWTRQFTPQFDDFLAEQQAQRGEALTLNYDYIMNWETHNEEGLRGAFDADAARQGARRRRRGGRGDLRRRRRHHRQRVAAVRRRPVGRRDRPTPIWRSPAPAPTTASSWSCARPAPSAAAASPRCRSATTSSARVAEIEWLAGHPGIRGIMIPTMWHDRPPYNDRGVRPGVGGVRGGRAARPHALG